MAGVRKSLASMAMSSNYEQEIDRGPKVKKKGFTTKCNNCKKRKELYIDQEGGMFCKKCWWGLYGYDPRNAPNELHLKKDSFMLDNDDEFSNNPMCQIDHDFTHAELVSFEPVMDGLEDMDMEHHHSGESDGEEHVVLKVEKHLWNKVRNTVKAVSMFRKGNDATLDDNNLPPVDG